MSDTRRHELSPDLSVKELTRVNFLIALVLLLFLSIVIVSMSSVGASRKKRPKNGAKLNRKFELCKFFHHFFRGRFCRFARAVPRVLMPPVPRVNRRSPSKASAKVGSLTDSTKYFGKNFMGIQGHGDAVPPYPAVVQSNQQMLKICCKTYLFPRHGSERPCGGEIFQYVKVRLTTVWLWARGVDYR